MKSILTLHTSAKNPDPIFSSLKSLRLVSWKTAERTAMKEALLGRGRLLPPSPWSRSSTWISSPILVSRSENYWLLHRSIALITAHVMTNNFTKLYGRTRLMDPGTWYVFSWRHRMIIWTFIHVYTQSINTHTPLKIGQIFTRLTHFQVSRPENKDRHKWLNCNTSFHKGSLVTVLVCAGALFVGLNLCQVGFPCTVLDGLLVCILLFLLFVGGQWKDWEGYRLPELL